MAETAPIGIEHEDKRRNLSELLGPELGTLVEPVDPTDVYRARARTLSEMNFRTMRSVRGTEGSLLKGGDVKTLMASLGVTETAHYNNFGMESSHRTALNTMHAYLLEEATAETGTVNKDLVAVASIEELKKLERKYEPTNRLAKAWAHFTGTKNQTAELAEARMLDRIIQAAAKPKVP